MLRVCEVCGEEFEPRRKDLDRCKCSVLSLVLKGEWYDMIKCGKKREEYRDSSLYWYKRINNWYYKTGVHVVEFRLGYKKDAPRMWFTASDVFYRQVPFNRMWGEPWSPHFSIALGERVDIEEGGAE